MCEEKVSHKINLKFYLELTFSKTLNEKWHFIRSNPISLQLKWSLGIFQSYIFFNKVIHI